MSDVIEYELRGAVAIITFNRPDRLNAMSLDMETAYFAAMHDAERDPAVRVVVTTGAGRGYCVGGDVSTLQKLSSPREKSETNGTPRPAPVATDTHDLPVRLAKPVIAAVNGACAGLGMAQALMCDIRIASEKAKFTTAFSRRGLIAEQGMSWILPRLVGRAVALDLLLSGRTFLGDEAARLGVVHRAVASEEVLDTAVAYAEDLATNTSPESLRMIKQQLLDDMYTALPDAMRESAALMKASWKSADFKEGVRSFVEKRPPAFAALPMS